MISLVHIIMVAMCCLSPTLAGDEGGPPPADEDPAPIVELWTMGRGADLFARFGHSALMVMDHRGQARIYNFGQTDFSRPDLAWSFLRGDIDFWLGRATAGTTVRTYVRRDRSVSAIPLALPPENARWLAERLHEEARTRESSLYRYDHFYDNCATRVRDRIDEATGGALRGVAPQIEVRQSWRNLAHMGISDSFWIFLGMETLLARSADGRPDGWEAMFLPVYLEQAVSMAAMEWPDGLSRPLAGEQRVMNMRLGDPVPTGTPGSFRRAMGITGLLMGLVALWPLRRRGGRLRRVLGALAAGAAVLVVGSYSSLVVGTAIISLQPCTRPNELVLWMWPLDALLLLPVLMPGRTRLRALGRIWINIRLGVLLLAAILALAGVLVQPQLHLLALWAGLLLVTRRRLGRR